MIFTILKGLEIVSKPTMNLQSSFLLGSLIYLGETVSSSVMNSYWMTSDITSGVINHDERSSTTSSNDLVYN